jgi:hypothetical protein
VGVAWFWVGPGAGWQLADAGPGLYLGFFERHRQLPLGFGLAEPVDTRSVLRGVGSLTREADGVGELLITGLCRDVSY